MGGMGSEVWLMQWLCLGEGSSLRVTYPRAFLGQHGTWGNESSDSKRSWTHIMRSLHFTGNKVKMLSVHDTGWELHCCVGCFTYMTVCGPCHSPARCMLLSSFAEMEWLALGQETAEWESQLRTQASVLPFLLYFAVFDMCHSAFIMQHHNRNRALWLQMKETKINVMTGFRPRPSSASGVLFLTWPQASDSSKLLLIIAIYFSSSLALPLPNYVVRGQSLLKFWCLNFLICRRGLIVIVMHTMLGCCKE